MAYLLTVWKKTCAECKGAGQREDEDFACPNCDGKAVEPVCQVVNGRLYRIFPDEPTEVPETYAAHIAEQKAFRGVVVIQSVRRKDSLGIDFDVDAARKASQRGIRAAYENALKEYVQQQSNRKQQNLAVLPPTGLQAEAIDELGIDLKQYNLDPAAYHIGEKQEARERELAELRGQNMALQSQLAAQNQSIDKLTKMVEALMNQPPSPPPPASEKPEARSKAAGAKKE